VTSLMGMLPCYVRPGFLPDIAAVAVREEQWFRDTRLPP